MIMSYSEEAVDEFHSFQNWIECFAECETHSIQVRWNGCVGTVFLYRLCIYSLARNLSISVKWIDKAIASFRRRTMSANSFLGLEINQVSTFHYLKDCMLE